MYNILTIILFNIYLVLSIVFPMVVNIHFDNNIISYTTCVIKKLMVLSYFRKKKLYNYAVNGVSL